MVSDHGELPAESSAQAKKARLVQLLRERTEQGKRYHPLSNGQRRAVVPAPTGPSQRGEQRSVRMAHISPPGRSEAARCA